MWIAAGIVAALFVPSNAPTPLYVLWQADLGFETSVITGLFAAYVVGLIVSVSIAGQCADRFGARLVLLLGLGAAGLSCIVFTIAGTLATLLVARTASGIAAGTAATAGIALVVERGGVRHSRAAPAAASAAVVCGAALGPLLAGTAALVVDRPVRPVFGAIFVLLTGAAWLASRLPAQQRAEGPEPRRFHLPTVPPAGRQHVLTAVVALGCGLSATAFILSLAPSVLQELSGKANPFAAGLTACSMFVSGTLVQLPAARLSMRRMFDWSAVALVLAMLLTGAAVVERQPSFMIAAGIVGGAGYGLVQIAAVTLTAAGVPSLHRAEANAVLTMGAYVPCGLVPVVLGLVVSRSGLATATIGFAGCLSAATIAARAFVWRAPAEADGSAQVSP